LVIFGLLALFLIQTLRQIKKTGKALEELLISVKGEVPALLKGIRETNAHLDAMVQEVRDKVDRLGRFVEAIKEAGETFIYLNRIFKGGMGKMAISTLSAAVGLKNASQYLFKHWSKGEK
jgi:uncharacterized protein YoxC